ncbi:competence protein ComJ [Komagataeibacter xylinus]|nr:competence protein ComJ [Komagataeibacter xylinus]
MFEGCIRIAGHQISLFDSRSGLPSHDWNATQREQGFVWQPGSVSFHLPENAEMAFVVEVNKNYRPSPVRPHHHCRAFQG